MQECATDGVLSELHPLVGRSCVSCNCDLGVSRGNVSDSEGSILHSKHTLKVDYTTAECIQPLLWHTVLVIIVMPLRKIKLKLMSAIIVCTIRNGSTSERQRLLATAIQR